MRLDEFLKEEDENLCEDLRTQLQKYFERLDLLMKSYSVGLPQITRADLDWDFLCKLIDSEELKIGKDVDSNIFLDKTLSDKSRSRVIIRAGGLQVSLEISNQLSSRYHLEETGEDVSGNFKKFDYWLAKVYQMTGAELFITEVLQKYLRACSINNGDFILVKEAQSLSDMVALTWAGFRGLTPKVEELRRSILMGDDKLWKVVNPPKESDQNSLLADNLLVVDAKKYNPKGWGHNGQETELYYGPGRVTLNMGYKIKCPVHAPQGIENLQKEVREKALA